MSSPLSQEKSNDPARQVNIHFDLKYVECDLAEERFENHPVVEVFLSGHFNRSAAMGGMISIPLDEHRLNNVYSGTLRGSLKRSHNKGIPIKSAIGIKSFAQHLDAHGHPVYVNVGTTHAYMGDIMQEQEKGGYDHQLDLMMRTTIVGVGQQIKKGTIELYIKKVEMGPSVMGLDHSNSPLQAPVSDIEKELTDYIKSTLQIESQLPDVIPDMSRIRAPMDISQVGIESTGNAFLPIAAFAMDEVPESNPEFFRNAVSTVLARKNMTRSHISNMPPHEKARTMGLLICYGVQSFGYVGDSVEKTNRHNRFIQRLSEGTEEFSNIWTSLFGDCEDSAKGIHSTLKAFVHCRFDSRKDLDLIELQQIAADYTPILTLAVVHGQKVGDHEGVGAHMYLPMLPSYQVKEGLSKTESGRRMLERMRPAERSRFVSSEARSEERARLIRNRPPLFCEGTGHIDPLGYKDPILDKRKYVATQMGAFTWAKQQIPHEEQGPSTFYFIDVSGVSSKFVDEGLNVGGFWFGTVNKSYNPSDPQNAHEMVRGLRYVDRLKDSENLALMPQPFMSSRLMSIIREANKLNPPPRPLVLDPQGNMGPKNNAYLDALVEHVEGLGRDAHGAGDPVHLYILPSQLNPHEIQSMMQCATQSSRLVDLNYTKEQVTNSIYHYRVSLYIK